MPQSSSYVDKLNASCLALKCLLLSTCHPSILQNPPDEYAKVFENCMKMLNRGLQNEVSKAYTDKCLHWMNEALEQSNHLEQSLALAQCRDYFISDSTLEVPVCLSAMQQSINYQLQWLEHLEQILPPACKTMDFYKNLNACKNHVSAGGKIKDERIQNQHQGLIDYLQALSKNKGLYFSDTLETLLNQLDPNQANQRIDSNKSRSHNEQMKQLAGVGQGVLAGAMMLSLISPLRNLSVARNAFFGGMVGGILVGLTRNLYTLGRPKHSLASPPIQNQGQNPYLHSALSPYALKSVEKKQSTDNTQQASVIKDSNKSFKVKRSPAAQPSSTSHCECDNTYRSSPL